jgi:hypothetical protein
MGMRTGFTFRRPDRTFDYRVCTTVEAAQTLAAFDHSTRSGVTLPDDWDKAYDVGYRVVSATLTIGQSHRDWRKYQKGK